MWILSWWLFSSWILGKQKLQVAPGNGHFQTSIVLNKGSTCPSHECDIIMTFRIKVMQQSTAGDSTHHFSYKLHFNWCTSARGSTSTFRFQEDHVWNQREIVTAIEWNYGELIKFVCLSTKKVPSSFLKTSDLKLYVTMSIQSTFSHKLCNFVPLYWHIMYSRVHGSADISR